MASIFKARILIEIEGRRVMRGLAFTDDEDSK